MALIAFEIISFPKNSEFGFWVHRAVCVCVCVCVCMCAFHLQTTTISKFELLGRFPPNSAWTLFNWKASQYRPLHFLILNHNNMAEVWILRPWLHHFIV